MEAVARGLTTGVILWKGTAVEGGGGRACEQQRTMPVKGRGGHGGQFQSTLMANRGGGGGQESAREGKESEVEGEGGAGSKAVDVWSAISPHVHWTRTRVLVQATGDEHGRGGRVVTEER